MDKEHIIYKIADWNGRKYLDPIKKATEIFDEIWQSFIDQLKVATIKHDTVTMYKIIWDVCESLSIQLVEKDCESNDKHCEGLTPEEHKHRHTFKANEYIRYAFEKVLKKKMEE